MNKRQLNRDLLLSRKYRQQIVKAKKGKGSFTRHSKHRQALKQSGGVFLSAFANIKKSWLRLQS